MLVRAVGLGAAGLAALGAAGADGLAVTGVLAVLSALGFAAAGLAAALPVALPVLTWVAGAAFVAAPLGSVLTALGALATAFLAAAGVDFLPAGLGFLSVLATCCLLVPGGMVPESGAFIPPLHDAIDGVVLGEVLSEGKPKLLKKESIHMAQGQPPLAGLDAGGPKAAR